MIFFWLIAIIAVPKERITQMSITLKVTMSLQDNDSPVKSKSGASWKEDIKLRELEPGQDLKAIVLETLMRGAISTSQQVAADTKSVLDAAANRYGIAVAAEAKDDGSEPKA